MSTQQKIEAYGEWVAIERKKAPTTSAGGIIIPSGVKIEPEYIGTVISIGPDAREGLSVGDRIIYTHNFPMTTGGEAGDTIYAMIHRKNIMAKVHDETLALGGEPTANGLRAPDQGP